MKTLIAAILSVPAIVAALAALSFYENNRPNGTLIVAGETRKYELYVPRSYDRAKPAPLVISMHGAGGWPVQQMNLSRWNRVADREGFLVVYPSGLGGRGPRVWRDVRDVRFISELIDTIAASYNVDRGRIYANGFSNGGGMAFVLSCMLSDRIAAVGMVGAAQTLPWSWCSDRHAVPMIAFHGTDDRMALYDGGQSWVAPVPFPAVPRWTANWGRRNRCASQPIESRIASDVTRRAYTRCADGADVVLYTIHGGGHTWPGGEPLPEWFTGPTTSSVDASSTMWAFFRAHPLRRRP
jgi:polyhydroxybutyrate depolymerase